MIERSAISFKAKHLWASIAPARPRQRITNIRSWRKYLSDHDVLHIKSKRHKKAYVNLLFLLKEGARLVVKSKYFEWITRQPLNSSLLTPRIGPSRLATPRCIFPRTDFPLFTIQYNLSSFASLLFQDLSHEMFFPDVYQLPKSQSWRFGSFRTTEAAEQVSCSFPRLAGLLSKSVYNEDFVVQAALQDRDWALFRRLRRRRWKAPAMEANSTRCFSIEMNYQNWEVAVAEARVQNREFWSKVIFYFSFLPPFRND